MPDFDPLRTLATTVIVHAMSIGALAACAFGIFVIGRMLVLGGASADGQGFRREEEPAIYWTIVATGCIIVCGFFYIAIFNPFEP